MGIISTVATPKHCVILDLSRKYRRSIAALWSLNSNSGLTNGTDRDLSASPGRHDVMSIKGRMMM